MASFERLLRASLPSQPQEDKPVSPTLLIGVGGTGKEVLLRLRRLVVERYGSLSALPFLQFIHLDTDRTAAAKEQYDIRGQDDPLYEDVKFKPLERSDLTIEGGTGKYVEHINTYPHIKRWFPTSGKIANLGNLGEGAGQIRLASRLGFYHAPNFTALSGRLEQARANLRNPAILNQVGKLGFDFNAQGMNVFVICSLAGGTGGGTFIDLGFLLQRFFPDAERVGILMLPGFFRDYAGGTRVRANGYAALMELNHYSFGHKFLANWTGKNSETLHPPPFSTTYLIDNTNEANLVIGSSGREYDAYQMIAEVLFHDYSVGKFAGMKRAVRVNLVNFNLDVFTHNFLSDSLRTVDQGASRTVVGETFPTRFGSFGMATIHFPTDRVHSSCGARLAAEILEFWQKNLLDDPLERLFMQLLTHVDVSFAQGRQERRDIGEILERADIENAILVYDSGGGKTFPNYLWEKIQSIKVALEMAPYKQKASALEQHLQELEKFIARDDAEDREEWGAGIRQLDSNARNYLTRVKSGIEKRADELANHERYGVAYTLSLLCELKLLLRRQNSEYLPHFEAAITSWRDETQDYSYQLDQLKLDLARHERQLLFRAEDVKRDLEELIGERDSENLGILYSYFYSRIMKQVAKRAKKICEEIDEFLGKDHVSGSGLLGIYYRLLADFERLKERLQAKARYFSREQKSELLISLYHAEDADVWYKTWTGEDERRDEVLRSVGLSLLSKVFHVDSVTAAVAHIKKHPVGEIEAALLAECKAYFSRQREQPEALNLLLSSDRVSAKQREEMVRRAYGLAKVWVKPAELGLEHVNPPPPVPDQRPCLVGIDTSNAPRLDTFKNLLRDIQLPGDSQPAFLNIGEANRGTIIFYNELGGVPAFYPNSVTATNGLREAYLSHPDKDELHFDKNRFQFGDLIPKKPRDVENYTKSLKSFVLARLLGLLKAQEHRDDLEQPTFRFSYQREVSMGNMEEIPLGDELQAIDALFQDTRDEVMTDRHQLLRQVDDTIEKLRALRLLWVYGLLVEFYFYQVYPPSRDPKWIENVTITQYSPQAAVLDQARRQVDALLSSGEERTQFHNAMTARRGKKPAQDLSYEEFKAALGENVKDRDTGKFAINKKSASGDSRISYLPVPALDHEKLFGRREVAPRQPAPVPAGGARPKEEKAPERPCPKCGSAIDARALVCRHCRKTLGQHVECSHCGETKVPDYLEECWRCGAVLRRESKIDCQHCFSFSGFPDQFPCPECGWSPGVEGADQASAPQAETPSDVDEYPATESRSAGSAAAPVRETASVSQVECPTCFTVVPVGAVCPECGTLLPAQ